MLDNYVDEICRLVGWQPGDFRPEHDWETVERELGLRLPSDYKELLGRFAYGSFRNAIEIDNPAEHPAVTKKSNDELIEIFADEDLGYLQDTTYRLFPEPGGLYPWGTDGAGGTFWWITDSGDPDRWRVAYNDRDRWHDEHSGPVSKVVYEVLVSTGTDNIFGWELSPSD